MHWGKHYLLMLLAAAVIGINCAAGHETEILATEQELQKNSAPAAALDDDMEPKSNDRFVRQPAEEKVQSDVKDLATPEQEEAEEFEEPELGQSLMALLSQGMNPAMGSPFGAFGRSPALAFNSLLPALTSFLALPSAWPAALLGAPAPTMPNDLLPASSKVVLMLSEDQQNKVKRSPILSRDFMRQLRASRQNPDLMQLPNAQELLAQYNQFLEQASPALQQTQDLLQQAFPPNMDQFLAQMAPMPILQQMLGQSRDATLEQDTPPANARILGQSSSASLAPAVAQSNPLDLLQQALQQFNSMTNRLLQPAGLNAAASQISEVRVKPDFPVKENEMDEEKFKAQLEQILNDKQRPILWFPSNDNKNAEESKQEKKTAEELFLESKLLAFERQVIKELKMLQDIVRQAALMRNSNKSGKETNSKFIYPLSQKPLHKITREDIETALSDEYVSKVLQKKFLNYAKDQTKLMSKESASMLNKRQSSQHAAMPQLSNEEAAQIMSYMYRTVEGTKNNPQGQAQKMNINNMQQEKILGQQKSNIQMYQGPMLQQNTETKMFQGPMRQQNPETQMFQGPMLQQNTETQMFQGPMRQQNPETQMFQGPMRQQKSEAQMFQGPMRQQNLEKQMSQGPMFQQIQETQMSQGPMRQQKPEALMFQGPMRQQNTETQMSQGPMVQQQPEALMFQGPMRQQNPETQMSQGPMRQQNPETEMSQGPMLQQKTEKQMYQGLMENTQPSQLESIDQMQRNWMQQQKQQESKGELENNDQERSGKFHKKIAVNAKKGFAAPPTPHRPVYADYSYAHSPSHRPSYGYGYRTQEAEQVMQQQQQPIDKQQQFTAENMKLQQLENDEMERKLKIKIKHRPAPPKKTHYDYAVPHYHQHHYVPSQPAYHDAGYSTYSYRTAVGDDEIESMLREHQTLRKLNSDEEMQTNQETTKQQDDQQQIQFNTNNGRQTSINSGTPTDEEIVGGIFDYLPKTLKPFMGLQAVERNDDPWLFKNYNLHHPVNKQDASYAAYVRRHVA